MHKVKLFQFMLFFFLLFIISNADFNVNMSDIFSTKYLIFIVNYYIFY